MTLFTHPADDYHEFIRGEDGCSVCGEGVMHYLHWRNGGEREEVLGRA